MKRRNVQTSKPQNPETDHRVSVLVPLGELDLHAHVARHVEVRLDQDQATTLRQVQNALNADGVRLNNGRYVQSGADTVRWILEEIDKSSPPDVAEPTAA